MSWVVDLNLAYIISFGLESKLSDFVLLGDGLLLLFHLLGFNIELRKLKFGHFSILHLSLGILELETYYH